VESNSQVKLDLSILSADFGCLGEQVAEATKADAAGFDKMVLSRRENEAVENIR